MIEYSRVVQILQKPGVISKFYSPESDKSTFHTEDPKMLGATLQNFVARDLCTPDTYVHGTLNRYVQHKVFYRLPFLLFQ